MATKQLVSMQNPILARTDWETPDSIFMPLDKEFEFTLDVCADSTNHKVPNYYSIEDDALVQEWLGRCWMNPPYGKEIPKWVEKAYWSSRNGATVVCLLPARTDTRWWHSYVEGKAETRFVKGRIKFVGAPFNAPFPSVVVIFRSKEG